MSSDYNYNVTVLCIQTLQKDDYVALS